MRYVVQGNDRVYGKSAETKDAAAVFKKAAAESKQQFGVKRSAEEDIYKESKKFRLHVESPDDETYASPPVAESSAELTKEEHVSLDDIMHEATLIGATMTEESTVSHALPPSAPFELPFRLPTATSSHVKAKELSPALKLEAELKPSAPLSKQVKPDHGKREVAEIISEWEQVEDMEELGGFSLADLAELYDLSAEYQDDLRDESFQGEGVEYFYRLAGLNKKGEEGPDSDSEDEEESEGEDAEMVGEYDYYYDYSGAHEDYESSTFICEDSSEDEYSEGECEAESGDEVEDDEDAEEDADDE